MNRSCVCRWVVSQFDMRIAAVFVAIMVAISGATKAKADPVTLACYGEMRVLGQAGIDQRPWKDSLSIVIDQQAQTITVGNYQPVPLVGNPQDSTVAFVAKPASRYGVSTGTLNRITGAASIFILPLNGGLLLFDGICKPNQLF
jgi:hypothetical protein